MGRQSTTRYERRRDRAMVAKILPEVLATEILADAGRKCITSTAKALSEIKEDNIKAVKKLSEETNTFRGMAFRDLGSQVSNEMYETNVTIIAFMEVIFGYLKLDDIPLEQLGKDVESHKTNVKARMQKEAREKEMEERRLNKLEKEKQAQSKEDIAAISVKPEAETSVVGDSA